MEAKQHQFKEYDGVSGRLNPVGDPKKEFRTGPVYFDREYESVNK